MKNRNTTRKLQHYRFPQKMLNALEVEAKRTKRSKTFLMEVGFALYMSRKAEERDSHIPVL